MVFCITTVADSRTVGIRSVSGWSASRRATCTPNLRYKVYNPRGGLGPVSRWSQRVVRHPPPERRNSGKFKLTLGLTPYK